MAAPTNDDWRQLYEAAAELRQLAPWEWMVDETLFGVRDPRTGEIGWCVVIGHLGQVLGVAVYLGSEGLRVHHWLQSGQLEPEDTDVLYVQKCLVCTFGNKRELEPPDVKAATSAGFRPKGRQAWPHFRSHRPGYLPWYLNRIETRFLCLVLRQVIEVALRVREQPGLLASRPGGEQLVRVLAGRGAAKQWTDEWLVPEPYAEPELRPVPFDQLRAQRIKKRGLRPSGVWEADLFHAPAPVHEGEQPYYPSVLLLVEQRTGLALGVGAAHPDERLDSFQDFFLGTIEQFGALPAQIYTRSREVAHVLGPIGEVLGFGLRQVKSLPTLDLLRGHLQMTSFDPDAFPEL